MKSSTELITTSSDSVDMSPGAIARRLDEVRRLDRLVRYLAAYQPVGR
jgi:hypothetical protein